MTGSAVVRELERKGYENIITESSKRIDLRDPIGTYWFMDDNKPEYVFNCAAHAGGILEAIICQGGMIYDNLMIQANIIDSCMKTSVKKLLNLASSCIYPISAKQPYTEEQLGDGKTDENWSYAIAKLAGVEMCRGYHKQYGCNFITAIPCNLYGVNDNFDPEKSHVIPALIRKCCEWEGLEDVGIWGDGKAMREFLYIDDFAQAAVMLMEKYNYDDLYEGVINMGSGFDISITELACEIRDIIDPSIIFAFVDGPKGIPSKLMDNSRIRNLGWEPKTSLAEGIKKSYVYYRTLSQSG